MWRILGCIKHAVSNCKLSDDKITKLLTKSKRRKKKKLTASNSSTNKSNNNTILLSPSPLLRPTTPTAYGYNVNILTQLKQNELKFQTAKLGRRNEEKERAFDIS